MHGVISKVQSFSAMDLNLCLSFSLPLTRNVISYTKPLHDFTQCPAQLSLIWRLGTLSPAIIHVFFKLHECTAQHSEFYEYAFLIAECIPLLYNHIAQTWCTHSPIYTSLKMRSDMELACLYSDSIAGL